MVSLLKDLIPVALDYLKTSALQLDLSLMSWRNCVCDLIASVLGLHIEPDHRDKPASMMVPLLLSVPKELSVSENIISNLQISSPLRGSVLSPGHEPAALLPQLETGNSAKPICLHQQRDMSLQNKARWSRTAHTARSLQKKKHIAELLAVLKVPKSALKASV